METSPINLLILKKLDITAKTKILTALVKEVSETFNSIENSIARNDYSETTKFAHKLCSNARAFGVKDVSKYAAQLEKITQTESGNFSELLDKLRVEVTRLLDYVEDYLKVINS